MVGTDAPDYRRRDCRASLFRWALETVTVALDANSAMALRERLASSPALRQALRGILEASGGAPAAGTLAGNAGLVDPP